MHIPPPITHLLPLLLLLLHANPALSSSNDNDAILLSKVKSLTLKGHGAQTRHRRVPPIPQLRCVNAHPELRRLAESGVDVMRCLNEGAPSYGGPEDVAWSCAAVLAPEVALAETDVVCEGYDGPGDERVLRGSCGVEYTVRLTPLGEEKYPHLVAGSYGSPRGDDEDGWDWAAVAFALVFLAVLGTIIYSACAAWTGNQRQPPRRRTTAPRNNNNNRGGRPPGPGWDPNFGGGWNNDNDDDNDPPPPYPGTGGSHSGGSRAKRSSAGSRSSSSRGNDNDSAGWRPGFWSGLGTGGLAGYAAGRRAGAQGRDDAATAGPSRQQARGGGEPAISRPVGSWSRSSGGSDFGSSSSTPHTSTGMGGTRRR